MLGWSGCTSMRPVVMPNEESLPPADTRFWGHIADAHPGDWSYVLNRGDEALDWRLRAIDSATVSVDLETFLWKPDRSGRQILARLLAAADRGVRVRILLDDSFTLHEDLALHALDEHPRIGIRIYNPYRHRANNVVLRQLFNLGDFSRVNHRMHNKALVVDGVAAIVGGRNLADEYFGRAPDFNFRDLEVLTAGRGVAGIVRHFDQYWNSGWAFPVGHIVRPPGGAPHLDDMRRWLAAQSEPAPPRDAAALEARWREAARNAQPGESTFFSDVPARDDPAAETEAPDQLAEVLTGLIDGARTEVILISAYLIPTSEFEAAIERAERRGVTVRILTNSLRSNNHLSAHSAYRSHIHRLVSHGADLHEVKAKAADRRLYMEEPVEGKHLGLHAKVLIIDDDSAYVGSCNLDPRSLKLNTEVGLIIRSPSLNRTLREALAVDFAPRNAWAVKLSEDGSLHWHGVDEVYDAPPAESPMQRLEDWFLGLLPIEDQM
ncbi:MAG: phospholipase D family protein [Verrucomicrobia bacterium]|nr:phospholipase D family protein [Verrucomicrobiota bacterium]